MKKLLLITSIVLVSAITAIGQNYIGLSQSKIIKRFGEPDEKGVNFIVYNDQKEEGTNIYYFDENMKCTAFLLTRKVIYFSDYQKILNKEFKQTSVNTYRSKSKGLNYLAEVTQLPAGFQIRIQHLDNVLDMDLSYGN